MASIEDAQRILWVVDTVDTETAVWRMHIAKKAAGAWSFVHDAMEDFWVAMTGGSYPLLAQSSLKETKLLEWDDVQKQFFQVSSQTAVALTTTRTCLPLQCAGVLSLLSTQPFGARRQSYQNRAFLGPVGQDCVGSSGKLASTFTGQVLDDLETFHDDIEAVANASGVTFTDGLAIVSETLENANPIVEATMGNIVDTQRRRRRSLVEGRVSTISF